MALSLKLFTTRWLPNFRFIIRKSNFTSLSSINPLSAPCLTSRIQFHSSCAPTSSTSSLVSAAMRHTSVALEEGSRSGLINILVDLVEPIDLWPTPCIPPQEITLNYTTIYSKPNTSKLLIKLIVTISWLFWNLYTFIRRSQALTFNKLQPSCSRSPSANLALSWLAHYPPATSFCLRSNWSVTYTSVLCADWFIAPSNFFFLSPVALYIYAFSLILHFLHSLCLANILSPLSWNVFDGHDYSQFSPRPMLWDLF